MPQTIEYADSQRIQNTVTSHLFQTLPEFKASEQGLTEQGSVKDPIVSTLGFAVYLVPVASPQLCP